MNKQNKILLGLLAFVVACTIGYALFSETITITGSATAKGDFQLTTTCEKGINSSFSTDIKYQYSMSGGTTIDKDNAYKNDSCTVSGTVVTWSADLTQPEANRNFTIKIKNTGSIPTKFIGVEPVSTERCVGNANDNTYTNCAEPNGNNMNTIDILGFETSTGTVIPYKYNITVEELGSFWDDESATFVLAPGESMYLRAATHWDDYEGDSGLISTNNSAYYKDTISYDLVFSQITAE